MPPRPPIPSDDLYARLGVPVDASVEAIEIAWRGLLRKHHPDVAGPDGLDLAKRINVARDWLTDPGMRSRYDQERLHGEGPGGTGPRAARHDDRDPDRPAWAGAAPYRRRPATTAERVAAIVERVGRLTTDDLDRLSLAEPAPIAFLATVRRFVSPELQAALDDAERAVLAALPSAASRRPGIRDAVVGRVAELILGDVLDELLGDPAGDRARERLTRGWDAAVGQPRYGPATPEIRVLLERLATLLPDDLRWLASTGTRERLGDAPWPEATSRDEDEALRVSTELAAQGAEMAIAVVGGGAAARRAAARIAHLVVLRHAFRAAAFQRHAAPWLGTLIRRPLEPEPRIRHRP
ncbi:MAG: DnaJ domain-containing protein [Chloroflexota bacterium]